MYTCIHTIRTSETEKKNNSSKSQTRTITVVIINHALEGGEGTTVELPILYYIDININRDAFVKRD